MAIQAVHDFARNLRELGPTAEADFNEHFKGQPRGNLHTFAGSVGHQPARS